MVRCAGTAASAARIASHDTAAFPARGGRSAIEAPGHPARSQHDVGPDWSLVPGIGYRDTSFTGYSTEAGPAMLALHRDLPHHLAALDGGRWRAAMLDRPIPNPCSPAIAYGRIRASG